MPHAVQGTGLVSSSIENLTISPRMIWFLVWLQRLLGVQMAAFKMHLICRWAQDEFEIFERDEDIPDIQPENPSDGS